MDDVSDIQPADPTGDEVPDGTQLPLHEAEDVIEEGDAGVDDTGDEPWYSVGDDD